MSPIARFQGREKKKLVEETHHHLIVARHAESSVLFGILNL